MAKFIHTGFDPGTDPMGIGAPFYGESSFDPVQFMSNAMQEMKANRLLKDNLGREAYKKSMEAVPDFKAWEEAGQQSLNKEVSEIQQQYYQAYASGEWDPMSKGGKNAQKTAQLNQKMRNLEGRMHIYEGMSELYRDALKSRANPSNMEKIDEELTTQKMNAFYAAPTIEEKQKIINQDGSLIVFKPQPIDVTQELTRAIKLFMPDADIDISSESWDPNTGLLRQSVIEKMDPTKVAKAMRQTWHALSEPVKNDFKRKFEAAPSKEKMVDIGGEKMPIEIEDWFVNKFTPEGADKTRVGYTRIKEDANSKVNWGLILPKKTDKGVYDLTNFRSTAKIADSRSAKITHYNSPLTIPLQGIFSKDFVMPTTKSTVDNNSGDPVTKALSLSVRPTQITVAPVSLKGGEIKDNAGNILVTLRAGDVIPNGYEKYVVDNFKYEAFVTSAVDYSKQQTPVMIEDIELYKKTQSYEQTNRMPLYEAEKFLQAEASRAGIDIKPMIDNVNSVLSQLNDMNDIFGTKKSMSDQEEYDELFKK